MKPILCVLCGCPFLVPVVIPVLVAPASRGLCRRLRFPIRSRGSDGLQDLSHVRTIALSRTGLQFVLLKTISRAFVRTREAFLENGAIMKMQKIACGDGKRRPAYVIEQK